MLENIAIKIKNKFCNKKARITCMLIFFWISLAAWTISSPVGSSPDEDVHITMIYCASKSDSTRCSPQGQRFRDCFSSKPNVPASCSNERDKVHPSATQTLWNEIPPVYYKIMSNLVSESVGKTTIKIRLLNITLAISLALLSVYFSSNEIRKAVAISWVVTSVPAGIFFLSSINPSSVSIMCMAALWGPTLTMVYKNNALNKSGGDSKAKKIVRLLFIIFLIYYAVGSRNEAFIWVLFIFVSTAAYWFLRVKRKSTAAIKFLVIAIAMICLLLFYLYSSSQAIIKLQSIGTLHKFLSSYLYDPSWITYQYTVNSILGTMAIGGIPGAELGIHDVPAPSLVSVLVSVCFGGCILFGLAYLDRNKILINTLAWILLFVIVSALWSTATWEIYQSRYFLPIMYFILGLALIPSRHSQILCNKAQYLFVFMSMAIVNSTMLLMTELRYLYGIVFVPTRYPLNKEMVDLNPVKIYNAEIPNWWLGSIYISPFQLWIVGSVSFLLAIYLFWLWIVEKDPLIEKTRYT